MSKDSRRLKKQGLSFMALLFLPLALSACSSGSSTNVQEPLEEISETMASLEAKYQSLSSRDAVEEFQLYIEQFEGKSGFEELEDLMERSTMAHYDAEIKWQVEQFALAFSDFESCLVGTREIKVLQSSHPWTHSGMDESSQATVEAVINKCVQLGVAYINERSQSSGWIQLNLDENLAYIETFEPSLAAELRIEICGKLEESLRPACLTSTD